MIISRYNLPILFNIFQRISNIQFDINTQYKLLKLKKVITEEQEIYIEQMEQLKQYCLKDEKGEFITTEDGGFAIDKTQLDTCGELVKQINSLQIQVPDIYFSLNELEPLNLTFQELEALDSFVKI